MSLSRLFLVFAMITAPLFFAQAERDDDFMREMQQKQSRNRQSKIKPMRSKDIKSCYSNDYYCQNIYSALRYLEKNGLISQYDAKVRELAKMAGKNFTVDVARLAFDMAQDHQMQVSFQREEAQRKAAAKRAQADTGGHSTLIRALVKKKKRKKVRHTGNTGRRKKRKKRTLKKPEKPVVVQQETIGGDRTIKRRIPQ